MTFFARSAAGWTAAILAITPLHAIADTIVLLPDGAISASTPTVKAPLLWNLPVWGDPQNLVRLLSEQGYTDISITPQEKTVDITAFVMDVPVRLIYDASTGALLATGGIHTNR